MWGLAWLNILNSIFPSGRCFDRAPSNPNLQHHFHHRSCSCTIDRRLQKNTAQWITCRITLIASGKGDNDVCPRPTGRRP